MKELSTIEQVRLAQLLAEGADYVAALTTISLERTFAR